MFVLRNQESECIGDSTQCEYENLAQGLIFGWVKHDERTIPHCVWPRSKNNRRQRGKPGIIWGKPPDVWSASKGWIISGKTREKVNDHGWSLNSHQASVTAFYNLIKCPHPQVPQSRRRKDNHKAEQSSASAFSSLPFQLQKVVPWTPGRSR